jgi:hypothetical protein
LSTSDVVKKQLRINPNFPTVTSGITKNRIEMGILHHRLLSAGLTEGAMNDLVIFHIYLQFSHSTNPV